MKKVVGIVCIMLCGCSTKPKPLPVVHWFDSAYLFVWNTNSSDYRLDDKITIGLRADGVVVWEPKHAQ